jgi:catechol 2,3-dioxygenase
VFQSRAVSTREAHRGIDHLVHVAVYVADLEEAATFYATVLGLAEVARLRDRVYLGGGRTTSFDVALVKGEAGLEHFAFAVDSAAALTAASNALSESGAQLLERPAAEEPGVSDGVAFLLPSGHIMELVTEERPVVYAQGRSVGAKYCGGIGPLPLDHLTLHARDIGAVVSFLTEHVGFRLTEAVQSTPGQWWSAFLRAQDQHHDLAFFPSETGGPLLNHVAFTVNCLDTMARALDILAELGCEADCSPGRHQVGNNLFSYFKDPSGNRIELSGDMTRIRSAAEPRVLTTSRFDLWRPGLAPNILSGT